MKAGDKHLRLVFTSYSISSLPPTQFNIFLIFRLKSEDLLTLVERCFDLSRKVQKGISCSYKFISLYTYIWLS